MKLYGQVKGIRRTDVQDFPATKICPTCHFKRPKSWFFEGKREFRNCEKCRGKGAAAQEQVRLRREDLGLCPRCGMERPPESFLSKTGKPTRGCAECREYERKMRAKRREEGRL